MPRDPRLMTSEERRAEIDQLQQATARNLDRASIIITAALGITLCNVGLIIWRAFGGHF